MDIRKWLTSSKATTTSGNSQLQRKKDSDSNKSKSPPKKSSRKRQIIESDSDEEPIPKDLKKSPKKNISNSIQVGKASPEKRKEISVSDFFGSGPVARNQKKDIPKAKKAKEENVHDDDEDFQATLTQLDTKRSDKKLNGHKKPSQEDDETLLNKKKNSKDKDAVSLKDTKEVKPSKNKRKSKSESMVKMEITPKVDKPTVTKIEVKEEKPAAKKPRSGGANYASYLHREGPRALGTKEIPEGEEDCLAGLTFIVTGVLESFERDEAKNLIEKYGGKVMTTLSKNTKYIVIGRDAGASKLEKAEKLGTKQLDEDGLLDLVRTLPGKGPPKKSKPSKSESKVLESSTSSKNSNKSNIDLEDEFEMDVDDSFLLEENNSDVKEKEEIKSIPSTESPKKKFSTESPKKKILSPEKQSTVQAATEIKTEVPKTFMWVDKYKPTNIKQIIGQQGDKSNAKKLLHWLVSWRRNRQLNKKAIPGRFNPNDDGSGFKAALLSGPPGVGKTTTAVLVCQEAGFDFFELNASDTRSKKNLQQMVSQLLGNQTLGDCFKNDPGTVSSKHVIIMDEVDGMSGNEDRGGMMELISFIKASKVPIICICNDRNHPKIRSLSNHCFDLRFQRPRVEQIKAAMMSIAYKENVQVSPNALQDVIVAANQDIRQVLHNMSMWSANSKSLTSEQTKSDIGRGTKHIKLGPFDVLREVFAIANNPKATLIDKSDLFFHDYSIAPLFVQENYVHVVPTSIEGNKNKHLTLLSETAESICIGDIIDKQIRSGNNWSLLPTQAIFASVVPGELMKGHLRQMINFPAWLGKNSNRAHMDRVLQELHKHMRMRVSGNKTDIALEYLPLLKRALTQPLIEKEQEGIPEALKTMEEYFLLREDFDSIIDLSLWPNQTDPRTKIITKVKSAFTRAYNKESGKNPYAVTNVKKKKGAAKATEEDLGENENIEVSEEEEEDDSIENDAMIKVKKPAAKKGASASTEPSTSKEKKKNPSKRGGKSR
ncbi:replication factor C subunit 1 [Trichonephila inaurata madagascariensis]|uniref:Replication factor C subunit 1 n=1 Tax=Trichonephila inaurata madagascariensis TaxID=2747483 RepID=A0A8X7CQW2_9ARAC|nr:replication factor C subunit 1 [Trichonephila inaurata madagascariensis]